MNIVSSKIPIPTSDEEFETITLEYAKLEYGKHAQKYGRKGQKQHGVDICTNNKSLEVAIQCKNVKKLTENIIDGELVKLKNYPREINKYIVATTAPRNNKIQDYIYAKSDEYVFSIYVLYWDEITSKLAENFEVFNKTFPQIQIKELSKETQSKCVSDDTLLMNKFLNNFDITYIRSYIWNLPRICHADFFDLKEFVDYCLKFSSEVTFYDSKLTNYINEIILKYNGIYHYLNLYECNLENQRIEVYSYNDISVTLNLIKKHRVSGGVYKNIYSEVEKAKDGLLDDCENLIVYIKKEYKGINLSRDFL